VLLEAAIAAGFYALAVPFGYLSRWVKDWQPPWKKWAAFLGLVHTPVLPLIVFARTAHPAFEYEALLVVVLLSGHLTGVLTWRLRKGKTAPAGTATAGGE
jgi:hypothetical protein